MNKPPGSLTAKDRLGFLQLHNVKVGQSHDRGSHKAPCSCDSNLLGPVLRKQPLFDLAESMKRTNTLRLLHLKIMAWMAIEATINNQHNSQTVTQRTHVSGLGDQFSLVASSFMTSLRSIPPELNLSSLSVSEDGPCLSKPGSCRPSMKVIGKNSA